MSGHSKWSKIKRNKAVADNKRGKIFSKLLTEISVAAKLGGGDLNANPRLRLAVENAKGVNMPSENIDRAIKKATGELEGVSYTELSYEAYGPGGIALIIETLTDNKNRTVAAIRHIFNKYGGSLAESGSVLWMFDRKGIITFREENKSPDEIFELILEAGADDLNSDENFFQVSCSVENFETIRKVISLNKIQIENASIQWSPKISVDISEDLSEKLDKLIDALEDCDDIQNIYTNL